MKKLYFLIISFLLIGCQKKDLTGEENSEINNTPPKRVVLTIDCETYANIFKILNILDLNQVKATFFITGNMVTYGKQELQAIVKGGHELGNHSWSHKVLTTLEKEDIYHQVSFLEQKVQELTGRSTKPWFRAPYGEVNHTVLSVLEELSYLNIYWDIDTQDWQEATSPQEMMKKIFDKVHDRAIILFHSQGDNTVETLTSIIPELKNRGWEISTLEQIFDVSDHEVE